MKLPAGFETLVHELRAEYKHGSFDYTDAAQSFRQSVRRHFSSAAKHYGVYIVRSAADDSVLYIGIGGSVMANGTLKGQDIVERLRNVRDGRIPADTWFRELLSRGPLRIQYFLCLPPVSPAFLEALLLQAYLNEHGRLPEKNRRL
jgi:hypothetical protein